VTTTAKMQFDSFETLKRTLESAHRDRAFLDKYVRELELHRQEEDVFLRLAFENVSSGGAIGRGDTFVVSVVSEVYGPLDAEQKVAIRNWWHEMVRQDAAKQFGDLNERLSKLNRLAG
jgi:hypothetical protein